METWHGRDEPDSFGARCALFQRLFGGGGGGGAVLGRGMAALPRAATAGAAPGAVLAHMAADATRAAAESPFLDGQLAGAASVLACIGFHLTSCPLKGWPVSSWAFDFTDQHG